MRRAKVGEVLVGCSAAEPMHVVPDRHMGQGVHVRPGVRRRHDVLGHVAETGVVDGTPRLGSGHPDPAWGPVVEHLERRMAGEEGHARVSHRGQRDHPPFANESGGPYDLLGWQAADWTDVGWTGHAAPSF